MNSTRRQQARQVRDNATDLAANRPLPTHKHNGEEHRYRRFKVAKDGPLKGKAVDAKKPSHIANFTKGLPHCTKTGLLLNPADYQQFVRAIQSGRSEDFEKTPLGPADLDSSRDRECRSKPLITCDRPATVAEVATIWQSQIAREKCESDPCNCTTVRAWESQAAGLLLDLEGPDAQVVTMPPAPRLDSDELIAEMAEVYVMALLRDTHFSEFRAPSKSDTKPKYSLNPCKPLLDVDEAIAILQSLPWFNKDCCELSGAEKDRPRNTDDVKRHTIFRGITPGDATGPYISQFLLLGNNTICMDEKTGKEKEVNDITCGRIAYGSITIDQRVRYATPCKDYMTTFEAWLDVQNGANVGGLESYRCDPAPYRFITTGRDIATYVHYDALYEAYLNACLIMLGMGVPFDSGLPFTGPDSEDKQQGFASFGGPHILSLVTEVATRALKAVRYQKFNVHRRLRPEALAGLIDRHINLKGGSDVAAQKELAPVSKLAAALADVGLLAKVREHNKRLNKSCKDRQQDQSNSKDAYFLPMAFPEGSPMHPSYGAGHATVAGACVTMLKAFFDHGYKLPLCDKKGNPVAYEANLDGSKLMPIEIDDFLTVEGELNKLASNIAIGRDWAGVHYFTDYIESLRMGEQIALGILEEQRLCYGENFTMTVPLFDGTVVRI